MLMAMDGDARWRCLCLASMKPYALVLPDGSSLGRGARPRPAIACNNPHCNGAFAPQLAHLKPAGPHCCARARAGARDPRHAQRRARPCPSGRTAAPLLLSAPRRPRPPRPHSHPPLPLGRRRGRTTRQHASSTPPGCPSREPVVLQDEPDCDARGLPRPGAVDRCGGGDLAETPTDCAHVGGMG